MSTRVIQISKFASGFRDPVTDVVLAGGNATFFVADGTYSVAKNAYEDIAKASAITGVTLDAHGAYPNGLYFDGATVYDIRIKDSAGTTKYSFTSNKIPQNTENVRTVTASIVTATIDDDVILCNTTSNAITVNMAAVATVVKGIKIKNIGLVNSVTVDGSGSELIDGSLTDSISPGLAKTYDTEGTAWYSTEGKTTGRALVETSSPYTLATGASGSVINLWDKTDTTIAYDEGGWFSAGAPTRFTVPQGVTKVKVGCNVQFSANATSYRFLGIQKNGSAASYYGQVVCPPTSATEQTTINISSGAVLASPGDYFDVNGTQETGGNLTLIGSFWIESVS